MRVCKRTSAFLVISSSIIFLALGMAISAASIAAMVTPAKLVVPTWYSGISLAAGLLIVGIAIFGFCGACRQKKNKCFMGVFTLFTSVVFVISVAVCVFVFLSDQAIAAAQSQNFVNLKNVEKTAAETLKSAVSDTWKACDASVAPTDTPGFYSLTCANSDYEGVQNIVNDNCLAVAVNASTSSPYYECYADASWWPPANTPPATSTDVTIDSPKGIFCQCADEVTDFIHQYFNIGKWISLGVAVFYLLTVIACFYISCCDTTAKSEQQAYFARP